MMTFTDIAHTMLTSMDFFELRKTAARYSVSYQGVRRQQLIRDIQRKLMTKSLPARTQELEVTDKKEAPMGAVSARPKLDRKASKGGKKGTATINNLSSRAGFTRVQTR